MARTQSRDVKYWRNKRGHEVDFVLTPNRESPVAIECKWAASGFSPNQLKTFRRQYPEGANFVVSHDVDTPFTKTYGDISVQFVGLDDLIALILSS